METYFIQTAAEIVSGEEIRHFDLEKRQVLTAMNWLPAKRPLDVVVTCGASCPDAIVDEVILRLLSLFDSVRPLEEVLNGYPSTEENADG